MLRAKQPRLVVTFHTTAEAMATEKLCKQQGFPGRLISAPRNVTADCGIAWSAPPETEQALLQALETEHVEIAGHYILEL